MMKQSNKVTIAAMLSALAAALMLTSYFPYLTYAIPAVSGLFIMAAVIILNSKWAFGAYLTSAFLVFLSSEPESKLLYIAFFGYYPIVKAMVEKTGKGIIEWPVKLIIFNCAMAAVYFGFSKIIGISADDFGELGEAGIWLLALLADVVFVLYDIAISNMAVVYLKSIHPKIKKFFK